MLKRLSVLLLLLLYSVTATGVALNLHYCGTHITSIKIDAPAKKCMSEKLAAKMKCCRDQHLDVKVKDAHQGQATSSFFSKLFHIDLPKLPIEDYLISVQKASDATVNNHGPPGACKVPIIIKNCTFRI